MTAVLLVCGVDPMPALSVSEVSSGRIVFVGDHVTRPWGVLEFDADGKHERRVATGNIGDLAVAVDGAIAYSRLDATQTVETAVLSDRRGTRVLGRGRVAGFSPDGTTLAVTRADGGLDLYDRASGLVRVSLPPADHFDGWVRGGLLYDADDKLHVRAATDGVLTSLTVPSPVAPSGSPDGRWVAYMATDGLRIVHPDGTNGQATGASCIGALTWAPDSTRLVCPVNTGLAVVGVDGSVQTMVTPFHPVNTVDWSADGTRLAFAADAGVSVATLETGAMQLVSAQGRFPRWSPDGRTLSIVFGDGSSVAVVPADGGAMRVVARDASAQWLPDGRLLAVVERHEESEVATMLPTGRQVRFIPHAVPAAHPKLSPDGSTLVYVTLTDGPTNVIACNADGTHRRVLAHSGKGVTDVTDVAWSPDGRRVAYVDGAGVKLIPASGGRSRLVSHTGGAEYVSWSPDGKRLAYAVYGGETTEIEVADLDGRHRQTVVGSGRPLWTDGGIDWSPDGRRIAFALDSVLENGEDVASLAYVDVRTHAITELGNELQSPAWSPDGRSIVGDVYGEGIDVVTVATATERSLAPGSDPSWSR